MVRLDGPLLLVGCGKMGGALLTGWLARGLNPEQVTVIEPNTASLAAMSAQGVAVLNDVAGLPPDYAPSVMVFAVKPQMLEAVIGDYRRLSGPGRLCLSIAAGKTVDFFSQSLDAEGAVVRAMPNLPASVGHGMTVLYADPHVSEGQRALCEALLEAVGEIAWIEDEALMDAVTAVSGGGPAYVFLLIECLAQAGQAAGLPEGLATRLARVTVAGSAELVRNSDEPASRLRENVSSPGGTTLEALRVLMADDGLQPIMTQAIAAATRRSRELAG